MLDELLPRCTFPPPGSSLPCAFSGGADSTALIALAHHAGVAVVAHHVDHRIRRESASEAATAASLAAQIGVRFELHVVDVSAGPNLEGRARAARYRELPAEVATGHTLDDQAETVLLRLLRGSGSDGLSAIAPGTRHPILALRRRETERLCAALGLTPVADPSNTSTAIRRNRVRHELLPLAAEVMERDPAPILARTAQLLRDDSMLLNELAATLDPEDARAIAAAPAALARRALRRWLTIDGYPPDAASIERVLDVARGAAGACELSDGRRIERSRQRFRIVQPRH